METVTRLRLRAGGTAVALLSLLRLVGPEDECRGGCIDHVTERRPSTTSGHCQECMQSMHGVYAWGVGGNTVWHRQGWQDHLRSAQCVILN